MLEYIINDMLREFLIFIGEIYLTLRSLQLFLLSGCLCYMSGYMWVFFLTAHFRVGVFGLPACLASHELAYKLGSPSKAVRCICCLTGHCALYPDLRAASAIYCVMLPMTAKRSSSQMPVKASKPVPLSNKFEQQLCMRFSDTCKIM